MRFIGKAVIGLTAGLCLGALVLPMGTAQADSSAQLPISSFYQMAVDSAHGHLFISQGSATQDTILVTNLSGQEVATITGQDGVMGIALSPDGSTLYAALSSSDAVTAISTATLQQTATYPLGSGDSPRDVAVQSGEIWVSYNTGVSGAAAIGDIDLTDSSPAFQTQAAMGGWASAPALAADPGNSGTLVAVDTGTETGSLASYNTAVNPATVLDQSGLPSNCENAGDLAVVPGGSDFILACGSQGADGIYSTADLSEQGSYPASLYPDSVAIDSSGDVAVGGSAPNNGGPYAPDLYIYHQGGSTPLNELGVNIPYNGELLGRGLAWSPDGSELFAVVTATYVGPTTYTLETVSQPTLTRSALTLSGPSSAFVTRAVKLTGNLSLAAGSVPAGTTITVTRTQAGSSATKTFTVSTTTDGNYNLTDTPPAPGSYTYSAAYAGTTAIAPATAKQAVTVSKLPVSLSVSSKRSRVAYDSIVHLTIHLGSTYKSRTVLIYAHDLSRSRAVLLRKASVGHSGTLAISYKAPHTTIFSVTFPGDAHYAAKTVKRTVNVLADVSEHFTGNYGKSGKYYLFHSSDILYAHATVTPNKHGQCVMFEVQEYFQGAWQADGTYSCVKLSKASTVVAKFGLSQADKGYPYRIRADFVRKRSDRSNADNNSSWRYLKVES